MRHRILGILSFAAAEASAQCRSTLTLFEDLAYRTGGTALTFVRDLAVGGGGKIAVADDGIAAVILLSSDGKTAREVGRAGRGPGEFSKVSNVRFRGDSLWVMDGRQGRATLFSPGGAAVRTSSFPRFARGYGGVGQTFPLIGDRYVTVVLGMVAEAAKGRHRIPVYIIDSAGAVLDSVQPPLNMSGYLTALALPGNGVTYEHLPTPRIDLAVVSADGRSVRIARGEVGTRGRRFVTLTSLDANGDTMFSRRIDVAEAPVSPAFARASFDSMVMRQVKSFPTRADAVRAVERIWQVDEHFWPVQAMFAGGDGRTWIQTSPLDNAWIVVNSGGSSIDCARVPAGVKLHTAEGGYAWGVRVDVNDVPSVVRLRIR